MRLDSISSLAFIELTPVGYEFPNVQVDAAEISEWDDWLNIGGRVQREDGKSWSFFHPCLTTREAKLLLDWLMSVADWQIPIAHNRDDLEYFTEPNIAFNVAGYGETEVGRRFGCVPCPFYMRTSPGSWDQPNGGDQAS